MRRLLLLALIGGSGLACWPGSLTIQVPFEPGAQSVIVAIESAGLARLYGVDPSHREAMALLTAVDGVNDERALVVTALAFSESLEQLGLSPGALNSHEGGMPLPKDSLSERQLHVGLGGPSDWTPAESRPQVVRDFLRPSQPKCRRLRPKMRWEFPDPSNGVSGLLEVEAGQVGFLIRTTLGENVLFAGRSDGTLERVDQIPTSMINVYEARTDALGRRWFVGGLASAGVIGRQDPGGSFQVLSTFSSSVADKTHVIFRFGPGDDSNTLYTVNADGSVSRYASELSTLVPGFNYGVNRPALAVLAPNELYYTRPDGGALLRYRNNSFGREQTVIDTNLAQGSDTITSLAQLENGESLAGTFGGELLKKGLNGVWDKLSAAVVATSVIWVIEPYRGGAILSGTFGSVQQYYLGEGVCQERVYTGNLDTVFYALILGEDIWVAGLKTNPAGPTHTPFMAQIVLEP